jgi:hypothetical protein
MNNMNNNELNMDMDDESDYGTFDDDAEIEDIMENEKEYYEKDKEHNQYVIGVSALNKRAYILSVSVSVSSFYKYNYDSIMNYCFANSSFFSSNNNLEILKIRIGKRGEYYVLVKTHWLKLIQRTWKKIYKKRQEQLLERRKYASLRHFEIRGRYPEGLNSLASIYGMLNWKN